MKYNIYSVRFAKTAQISLHEDDNQSEAEILKIAKNSTDLYIPSQDASCFVVNVEVVEIDDRFKAWSYSDGYGGTREAEYILVRVYKDSNGELILEYFITGVWTSGKGIYQYKMSELLELEIKKDIQFRKQW